uniref:Uncharacterized protein n=1 Tax=Brassica oleracea var. oleracea TaxID=109376 RepID=A0A0D3AF54_BRAOL
MALSLCRRIGPKIILSLPPPSQSLSRFCSGDLLSIFVGVMIDVTKAILDRSLHLLSLGNDLEKVYLWRQRFSWKRFYPPNTCGTTQSDTRRQKLLVPCLCVSEYTVDPMLHMKTAECNMVLDESKTCDRRRQKETLVGTLVLVLCFHVKKKKTNVNLQVVFINMLTLSLYKRV